MSRRPIERKQRRRAAKALRRRPLPAFIDLVEWLKTHGHASTTGEARQIILDKRVKSDSHTLGVKNVPTLQPNGTVKDEDVVSQAVPADLRGRIRVTSE